MIAHASVGERRASPRLRERVMCVLVTAMLVATSRVNAQVGAAIEGCVLDAATRRAIADATVTLDGVPLRSRTDSTGT